MLNLNRKEILSLLKDKKARLPIILLLIGVILLIIPLVFGGANKSANSGDNSTEEYKESLEKELADLCSDIDGVGKCKVFITFERGEQNTYKGGELVESRPPKVQGVTVVCKGANSNKVKAALTEMITALFDIGSNRVAILKLN